MDNDPKNEGLTPPSEEEKASEEEALKEPPQQDDLRSQLAEKYNLDQYDTKDTSLLDRLVQDHLEERKKLSTAIKQKRSWREKAHTAPTEQKPPEQKAPPVEPPADWEKKVEEKLEQREIDSLDLSDELKGEVKTYAKLMGISAKAALTTPYIQFRKGEIEKKEQIDNASLGGKRRSMANRDFSEVKNIQEEFDLSTEEGRKQFAAYGEWLKTQG